MATRIMRSLMGLLLLIGQFLDPATRWLSWSVAFILLFEGITNIRIIEYLLNHLFTVKSSSHEVNVSDRPVRECSGAWLEA